MDTVLEVARDIYKSLGPGRRETIYQTALKEECARSHNLHLSTEIVYPILFKGYPVGFGRLDLFIPHHIIIECKAVNTIGPKERAQCQAYTRDHKLPVLLINFGMKEFTHEVIMVAPASQNMLRDSSTLGYGC